MNAGWSLVPGGRAAAKTLKTLKTPSMPLLRNRDLGRLGPKRCRHKPPWVTPSDSYLLRHGRLAARPLLICASGYSWPTAI